MYIKNFPVKNCVTEVDNEGQYYNSNKFIMQMSYFQDILCITIDKYIRNTTVHSTHAIDSCKYV